ncbi:MAG TPA: lysylphosphatidylglycerol synthase transmembrane domain-containing protein [Phycisphaerae bacterium]|nr:lysylphosphatidylglycerol synthase transmembrane domain-containing protein [Phycisphaerae bacterium]HRW52248.1 lysylphosphatidylglycerol synthase transmembrane domain-containing protein [Phycisphaerae bacterium]
MSLSDAGAIAGRLTEIRVEGARRTALARGLRSAAQIAVATVLMAWLIRSGALRWPALAKLFDAPRIVAVAMFCVIANYVFLAMRLSSIVRAAGGRLSRPDAMRFTMAAAFAGWLIPGGLGSDLAKAYLLGRGFDGDVSKGIGVALVDRLLGLAALMALAVGGMLATLDRIRQTPALMGLLVACVAILIGFAAMFVVAFALARRNDAHAPPRDVTGGIMGVVKRVTSAIGATARRPSGMAMGFFWSLCAQASIVGAAVVVCVGLTGATPSLTTCALVPVGFVANALPLAPGGLGVGEAVFDTLFAMAGTAGGAEIALSWRALAVIGSLPGLWFLIRWARRRGAHPVGQIAPTRVA